MITAPVDEGRRHQWANLHMDEQGLEPGLQDRLQEAAVAVVHIHLSDKDESSSPATIKRRGPPGHTYIPKTPKPRKIDSRGPLLGPILGTPMIKEVLDVSQWPPLLTLQRKRP